MPQYGIITHNMKKLSDYIAITAPATDFSVTTQAQASLLFEKLPTEGQMEEEHSEVDSLFIFSWNKGVMGMTLTGLHANMTSSETTRSASADFYFRAGELVHASRPLSMTDIAIREYIANAEKREREQKRLQADANWLITELYMREEL